MKFKKSENGEDLIGGDDHPWPQTIGDEQDGADLLGDDDEEEGEGGEEPWREELQTIKEQLNTANQREARYMQTINQLLQTRSQGGEDHSGDAGNEVSFDDLPDPVEDRKAFNAELGKRISQLTENLQSTMQTNVRSTVQRQNAAANLETQFAQKYGDLAKRKALLRAAVQEEAEQMRSQGLDPQQAVMNDTESFMESVATRMRTELGIDESGGGKPRGRTKGVGGGSRAKGGSKPAEKKPKGFMDQLKKVQLDSGLI